MLAIFLFILYFSILCCIFSSPKSTSKSPTETEIFDNFEHFCNSVKEVLNPPQQEYIPVPLPILPPTKERQRRHNSTAPVHNGVIVTPPPASAKSSTETITRPVPVPAFSGLIKTHLGENPTIREIRQYIKESNLQSEIRARLGKSVSKAKKQELMCALGL